MSSSDPFKYTREQLLDEVRPQARQQIAQWLKSLGPAAKETSKGVLMGGFLAAILAPLAATAAGAGDVAQVIATMFGGVGGNLLSGFVQRFYDAQDEQKRQQVLDEIVALLQAGTEKSEEILDTLHELIERIDALAALQSLGGAEAKNFEDQLQLLRPIPADLRSHRRFVKAVKKVLRLQGAKVSDGFTLSSEHRADLLVSDRDRLRGREIRTVVQCVTTAQGRADEQMLTNMLGRLKRVRDQRKVDSGLIVTDTGLSPSAQELAEDHEWEVRRYDDLLDDLMDFSDYLDELVEDFTKPRADSDLPGLRDYYVDLLARNERGSKDDESFDLLSHVRQWIDRPSPAKPLMLLGEYGTGKTTFCRRLAYQLARQYQDYRDQLAAGRQPAGPRPRRPLLINLLHFVENQKLDALITYYLDQHCHVDRPQFKVFEALNEAGFFVIILDGFDEMAVRVDSSTIEKHLFQIEQLAKAANSRVLLTGRPEFFMSRKEMERALWLHQEILPDRFKDYDVLRLQLWEDEQIKAFLRGMVPHLLRQHAGEALPESLRTPEGYFRRLCQIQGFHDDLAQRAVLLEMITQTLHLFQADSEITRPSLYQRYLEKELSRQRLKKGRKLLLSDQVRLALLQRLAPQTYLTEGGGIAYQAAEELAKPELPPAEQRDALSVAHHTREFLSCSFLRPAPGDLFVFSHRSFRGYLAAKDLMKGLLDGPVGRSSYGAKPQPIDQDCIRFLAEMMPEVCTADWYRRQVAAALQQEELPDGIKQKSDGTFRSALPDGFEVEMVYVPAGPYVLGGEGEYALPPQIAVLEEGFWIDKTPVTNEQYQHFLDANPKHREPFVNQDWAKPYNWKQRRYPKDLGDHPVVLVDCEDAQAFCRWAGKALPDEKQWEKAARGLDGREWPWGNTWDRNKCNSASWWAERDLWDDKKEWKPWWEGEFKEKYLGKIPVTTAVRDYGNGVSPYGCLDCAGNMWEWCANTWDEQSKNRVVRGGAWGSLPQDLACADRVHRRARQPQRQSGFSWLQNLNPLHFFLLPFTD